jgi:hypothetical protein
MLTIQSLDANVPYAATVSTTAGAYRVSNVPEGVMVEVTATKDGFTTRTRVQAFQEVSAGNTLDFGGTGGSGRAYFISDYPEIIATSPTHDQRVLEPTRLSFKVALSEPIDEDSRDAFEKAFAIVPTNAQSSINETGAVSTYFDVSGTEKAGGQLINITAPRFAYSIREGDTFLASSTNKVRTAWNVAGNQVTYTFDGNIQAGRTGAAEYQAVLFTPDDPIEDPRGNQLGTNAAGGLPRPPVGDLLSNAFKALDLAYDGTPGQAWAQTHTSAVPFEVRSDAIAPKLVGVSVVEDNQDLRIELTFSEPMAAYVGSGKAHIAPSVFDLRNYSFMVGQKSTDLINENLNGLNLALVGGSVASMRAALTEKREFQFDDTSRDGYVVARGG